MRLFMPLVLVAAAIGLFIWYTNPTYQAIKALSIQNASYDDALTKAKELRSLRESLLSKRNGFAPNDLDKLLQILPDNVDNIRLIIDINSIATRHNLTLTNVDLGSVGGQRSAAADAGNTTAVGSVNVGFSVTTANYADFLAFVQDVEHSLRLVDITKMSFTAANTGAITYLMTVRTYWLH